MDIRIETNNEMLLRHKLCDFLYDVEQGSFKTPEHAYEELMKIMKEPVDKPLDY